jgi:hypothetical protein
MVFSAVKLGRVSIRSHVLRQSNPYFRSQIAPTLVVCSDGVRKSFSSSAETPKTEKPVSLIDRLWGKEASVAPESFKSRWLMVVPALMTHVCIGKFKAQLFQMFNLLISFNRFSLRVVVNGRYYHQRTRICCFCSS